MFFFFIIDFLFCLKNRRLITAEADVEYKHTFVTEPNLQKEEEHSPRFKPEHIRLDSYGAASETESESSKVSGLETMDGRLLYRHYIERALKSKGLRKMLRYNGLAFIF